MNNTEIANETIQITGSKKYVIQGLEIHLPDYDYGAVTVYTPERGLELLDVFQPDDKPMCSVLITNEDSFTAAGRYENALVMNFANAHHPGGGFRLGATAQEEALCRCSTLYKSISGVQASEMYHYNNTHVSKVESDYMLLSNVCVFRDAHCKLLEHPFSTGVITVPAPNRIGAAMFASEKEIKDAMLKRIRIMLLVARENGFHNLILGAWGCGAFHNNPEMVAACFRQVLIGDKYGQSFNEVCFAIYGKEKGKNIIAFQNVFSNNIKEN